MNNFVEFLGMGRQTLKKTFKKLKLDKTINDLISQEDFEGLLNFLERGYMLSDKQLSSLMMVDKTINHQETMDKMFEIFERDYKDKFLKSIDKIIKVFEAGITGRERHDDTTRYPRVLGKIVNIYNSNLHALHFICNYNSYKQFFSTDEASMRTYVAFEKMSNVCGAIGSESHMQKYYGDEFRAFTHNSIIISDDYRKILDVFKKQAPDMEDYVHQFHESKRREVLTTSLNEFSDILKPANRLDIAKPLQKFELAKLPVEAQTHILKINHIYSHITDDQNLDVANLYGKRLPQVIEQYRKITPEYKKLHNPDILLVESLAEIHKRLDHILQAQQHEHLNELKITHRYLKN